jgi:Flp pilus assembly protein TadD
VNWGKAGQCETPFGFFRSSRVVLSAILLAWVLADAFVGTSAAAQRQIVQKPNVLEEAQASLDHNKPDDAIRVLTSHLRTHPTDDTAHLLLASAFVMTRQASAAEEQYRAVLKDAPENYIALTGLGELYASTGRFEEAESAFAQAVKHSRQEPQLRIEWAQVLTKLHRYKQASTALDGVNAPSSRDPRASFYRLKAAIAEGLGNTGAAAKNMENALAARPYDSDLQLATAVVQLNAGKSGRAARLAADAFSKTHDPSAGVLLLQAQIASHGDIHGTLQSLRMLTLPTARQIALRQSLAEILIAQREFSEAVTDLKEAVELDPTNADFRFNLALAQLKAGNAKDALATGLKCKELRDGAEVEGLLGDIQEALGDNLAAVKSYQAAVALAPADENHYIALALEFIRHRNFEPAKLVLENAEKLSPNSWRVQVGLGMVEYFSGTKEKASQILLRAVDLAPRPELALTYLGDIELDETSVPDAPAAAKICDYANAHADAVHEQFYCGAVMFRMDYAARDTSRVDDIIRRLALASKSLPYDAKPHCELGKVYVWLDRWEPAREEFEDCARLNPNSAQAHYRLAQAYHRTGQRERAAQEIKLYKAASQRMADENEQHETTLNTFLYTIQEKPEAKR